MAASKKAPHPSLSPKSFAKILRSESAGRFHEKRKSFSGSVSPKERLIRILAARLSKEKTSRGRTFLQERSWFFAKTDRVIRYVHRIALFRPDEDDVILVTDLIDAEVCPATELLAHDLKRRGIERMFPQVTELFGLQHLISGTPEAMIFQFSFCLVLYNVTPTIRGCAAKNQECACESISIENLYFDTRALSKLEIGVHSDSRGGGNPDRDTGFTTPRE